MDITAKLAPVVAPVPAGASPREMMVTVSEVHGNSNYRVEFGVGSCPWCGRQVRAEVGRRGYCPDGGCAGPMIAVVRQQVTIYVLPPESGVNVGHLNVGSTGHQMRVARRAYDELDDVQQRAVNERQDELMDAGLGSRDAFVQAVAEAPPSRLTAAQRDEYDRLCAGGMAWRKAYGLAVESA